MHFIFVKNTLNYLLHKCKRTSQLDKINHHMGINKHFRERDHNNYRVVPGYLSSSPR